MSPVNNRSIQSDLPNYADFNRNYFPPSIEGNKYDLRGAVKLPDMENKNEWIAKYLFDFHKQVCWLYATISEHCTRQQCPEMTAGMNKYLWSHEPERRPVDLCASEYIYHSLEWVQQQLDDDDMFPAKSVNKEFPPNFGLVAQTIAKRLFRVFAHVYHHHLTHVRILKEEAHMNTSLKHFIYFVKEFDLITPNELAPLKDYVEKLDVMSSEENHDNKQLFTI